MKITDFLDSVPRRTQGEREYYGLHSALLAKPLFTVYFLKPVYQVFVYQVFIYWYC